MQSNDTFQSPIWEGANLLISPFPETLAVDSVHSQESKEPHLSSCQFVDIQTMDPIHNIFIDGFSVTANDNCIHPSTNLAKLPILNGMSFESSEVCQDDEALQLPLMVISGPHVLDKVYEQFQNRVSEIRVSVFESSQITVTLDIGPSFQGYHVEHPLHHGRVVDRINLADYFTSPQHLPLLALDLGLSINRCMLWLDDYKFHVCGSIYQDWVAVFLERSSLTYFPIGGRDIFFSCACFTGKHVSFCVTLSTNSNCLHFVFAGW